MLFLYIVLALSNTKAATPQEDIWTFEATDEASDITTITHHTEPNTEGIFLAATPLDRDSQPHIPQQNTQTLQFVKGHHSDKLTMTAVSSVNKTSLEFLAKHCMTWDITPSEFARISYTQNDHPPQVLKLFSQRTKKDGGASPGSRQDHIISIAQGTQARNLATPLFKTQDVVHSYNVYPPTQAFCDMQTSLNPSTHLFVSGIQTKTPVADITHLTIRGELGCESGPITIDFYLGAVKRSHTFPLLSEPKPSTPGPDATTTLPEAKNPASGTTRGLAQACTYKHTSITHTDISTNDRLTETLLENKNPISGITSCLAQACAYDRTHSMHAYIATNDQLIEMDIYANKTTIWSLPEHTLATCTYRANRPSALLNAIRLIGKKDTTASDQYTVLCVNESTRASYPIIKFQATNEHPAMAQISTFFISNEKTKVAAICNINLSPEHSISILAEGEQLSFQAKGRHKYAISYNTETHSFAYSSRQRGHLPPL